MTVTPLATTLQEGPAPNFRIVPAAPTAHPEVALVVWTEKRSFVVGLDAYELQDLSSQWIMAPLRPTAHVSSTVRMNIEYRLGDNGTHVHGPTGLLQAVHEVPSIDLIMVPPAPTSQKSFPVASLRIE